MKYECNYNPNLNAIEVSTHGAADLATLIEMLHRIADLCLQERSANVLLDHSELDATHLTMENVERLSLDTVSLKDIFKMRKCANVVAKDYQFGLVRAWEIMLDIKGFTDVETTIFKNREEAIEWIKVKRI